MATTILNGSWAKWKRADTQSSALYEEFRKSLKPIGMKIVARAQPKPSGSTDPRRWGAFTFEVSEVPAIDPGFGLYVGEIIHNLRGSLDHLAWILVGRALGSRNRHKVARDVLFPMASRRKDWPRVVNTRLPGIPFAQRKLVERYQPYRRSPLGRAIRNLQTLSNTDKHRLIVPIARYPRGGFNLRVGRGAQIIQTKVRMKPGQDLKVGTRVITAVLAETRPGGAPISGSFEPTPGFRPSFLRPAPGETVIWVDNVIEEAKSVCAEILREIEPIL